jgi:VIT1/CCC1 family predicted Fe2+/Mn2+ transporter
MRNRTRARRPGHRHRYEPHDGPIGGRLNWLRAGVLGANDGLISTAGLVVGVAAATTERSSIATAGLAGLAAGAVSMALGEYVSVSTQRDTEEAIVATERDELRDMPEAERHELVGLLERRGLQPATAQAAADELTAHDALGAHLDLELGIDPTELADPWAAAASSAVAFTLGALVPILAILLPPERWRIGVTMVAVLAGLALTGEISARVSGAPRRQAILRLLIGGGLAMAVTYGVGELLGAHVG